MFDQHQCQDVYCLTLLSLYRTYQGSAASCGSKKCTACTAMHVRHLEGFIMVQSVVLPSCI
jgi:hypothetical protein